MAAKQDDLQIGADLFDFDELLRDVAQDTDELGAAFDAVLETTGGTLIPGALPADHDRFAADAALFALEPPTPAPLPAPTHRVRPTPPPLGTVAPRSAAPAPQPVRAPAPAAPPAGAPPVSPVSTVLQRITLSPGLIVVLALIAVLNLGLVAFVVRALTTVQSTVVEVGHQVIQSSDAVRAEASELVADHAASALPVVSARPEGLTALERARAQFEVGAWESGRQTLFALLAVIDRVPPEVRLDIEARARFLLADSWRQEAEALDRSAARGAEVAQ